MMAPSKKKIPIGWDDLVSISSMIPMNKYCSNAAPTHLSEPR